MGRGKTRWIRKQKYQGQAPVPDHFDTLRDFVAWLTRPETRSNGPVPTLWFRGHPDRVLELLPGVLRPDFLAAVKQLPMFAGAGRTEESTQEAAEIEMNRQFRRESAALLPEDLDPVELYLLAQHHGLPTRLLDWTTNGLAALFFTAVKHPDRDGEVIVLSPSWRLTTDDNDAPYVRTLEDAPFPQRHPLVRETIYYLYGEGERPEHPMILPVLPDLSSRRMLEQGACFTLHMPGSRAINESAVTRFVIPKQHKAELLAELRSLGVNWSTLFPDLDHLCLEIRNRWEAPRG